MFLPRFVRCVQHFPSRALDDIPRRVGQELSSANIGPQLSPNSRIAIAVGSRGVANLSEIVRATVTHFRQRGFQPFIVPAMGSHGGGTASGQIEILAKYGVTEANAGCPIRSSIETVSLGRTSDNIETYFDRYASESDGVFLINRIKWHTTFEAPIESGLLKMASIGLGKVAGATAYHQHAVRSDLGTVVRSVGKHVLATGKVIGGLALLEDAHHATAQIAAIPAARLEEEEERLLVIARSWAARILFDEVDVLIVDEIGKQISGAGMDSKIVNRHPYGTINPWPWAPRIGRIYIRDLSPLSYGNAIGLGMADMISERLFRKIDWHATRVNGLAASNFAVIRTPIQAANDCEALRILASAVGQADPKLVTYARIRNTLELADIQVSENLVDSPPPGVEVAGPPAPMAWTSEGDLQ